MSHTTSIKRRLGAAVTSFVTAAALAVPLASPALAAGSVQLLNPDYGSARDVQHVTAWASDPGSISQVVFTADCDATEGYEVAIGSDTTSPYGVTWNNRALATPGGTSCTVRAQAFFTAGGSTSDYQSTTLYSDNKLVDMTAPAHGAAWAFHDPVEGGNDHGVVSVSFPAGSVTPGADVRFSKTSPGSDPSWTSCGAFWPDTGAEAAAADVDGDTSNGYQYDIECSNASLVGVTAVMVDGWEAGLDEYSTDAHKVTSSASNPELYAVTVSPSLADADTAPAGVVCNEYTVTVKDANGAPVAGVNLDVHATGPSDGLAFATTLNTDPFTAADASGIYAGDPTGHTDVEAAADCTLAGEGNVFEVGDDPGTDVPEALQPRQAVHEDDDDDPDAADTKHIEGNSDASGTFTFAIYSPVAGTTSISVWADTLFEDDINDAAGANRERDTTTSKTWYDAVATTLVLDPAEGWNNLRTDHTVTATLTDQNGVPLPGHDVLFTIGGPNEITLLPAGPTQTASNEFDQTSNPCSTDGLGMCTFTYTDNNAGAVDGYTDSLLAWVNTGDTRDTSGGNNPNEPQSTATKHWVDVDDACLDASPEYGLNAYDAVHTILVTVRATDGIADGVCTGEPIENATVLASILLGSYELDAAMLPDVDGDEDKETLLTDVNGQVSIDLSQATAGEAEGWNTVEFVLDGATPPGGSFGGTWEADDPAFCDWWGTNCQRDLDDEDGIYHDADDTAENAYDSVDKEWAVPGRPYDVTLLPRYSSNELRTAHTVTATVTDAFGTPVVGDEVTIEVSSGPNAGTSTVCTTNASGSCSFTYTDALAVDGDKDNIRATASNGRTGTAYKYWYTDAEADAIAIDMEWQCNPNLGAGFGVDDDDCDSWELDANPNEVDTGHWLVASAKSGAAATGDVLYGEEITFTISGVGEFVEREYDDETDEWSWISLGTTVSTPISGNGYAAVQINSTAVGTSTVNASIDDQSIDGTKDWYAGDLRNLVFLEPTSIRRTPGTIAEHTAQATDRFGNVVPFWDVCFSETGPGTIRTVQDQFNTNCDETDEDGNITIEVQTNAAESGTQTITAESDEGERYQNRDRDGYFFDCEAFAGETATGGMAAGVPEGNCSDEATVIWSNIGDAVDVDPTDPTEQTIPPGSASCFGGVASDSNGNGVPDQAVGAMLTGANGSVTPTVNTGDCPSGTAGSGTGSGTTDANGVFSATYTPTNSGTDTLRLFVDLNENGAYDDGEPFTDYVLSVEAGGGVDTGDTVRLAGPNRIATALAISGASFADDAAGAVVLARSDDFPDALAGTPLAVAKNAPTLLTESSLQSSTLNSDTRAEIDRVLPSGGTVYILGGTVAVPAGAESELVGAGYTVIRLGGADRYATAILIADAVSLNPDSILITTGTNFPDALAAGSAAVSVSGVIVLSRGTEKASATDAYLARAANADATLFAIGGPSVTAYGASVPDANEIAGATRLSTSINVANRFFSAPTVVGIATMRNFPDALTGGAHIARLGGPLVLVNGDNLAAGLGSQDAGIVQAYLEGDAESIDVAYIYGGTVVVSNFAQLQIDNAITANN